MSKPNGPSFSSWAKHLRPEGKRAAAKLERRLAVDEIQDDPYGGDPGDDDGRYDDDPSPYSGTYSEE